MSNYTGPERRKNPTPTETSTPLDQRTKDQFKAIVRWGMTLSSFAMLAFAGLTFAGVLPFPQWTALLFVSVAAIDLVIAYVVFSAR